MGEFHDEVSRNNGRFAPLPGDIGLTPGLALVRFCQTAPGEPATRAGHVFGFVGPGETLEALWRVRVLPWAGRRGPCEVWRRRGLSAAQRGAVAEAARAYAGRGYGWWKLAAHLADWFLAWALFGLSLGRRRGEAYVARRLLALERWPICSWVWARAYVRALGLSLGEPGGCATPDGMRDHFMADPAWELVFRRAG